MKKPKCRIKVTLKCNRNCGYCINKNEEYQRKLLPCTGLQSIDFSLYRTVIISGGEPTYLGPGILGLYAKTIRENTPLNVPIYLQTNGFALHKKLVKQIDDYIDGIGLSIHDFKEFDILRTRYKDILRIKPIRLYIQEGRIDPIIVRGLPKDGFTTRIWRDGEFDKTEEIYVLS